MIALSISIFQEKAETLKAVLAATVVGVTLVFVTGFSHIENVHNAAHDTRHALSFPCH